MSAMASLSQTNSANKSLKAKQNSRGQMPSALLGASPARELSASELAATVAPQSAKAPEAKPEAIAGSPDASPDWAKHAARRPILSLVVPTEEAQTTSPWTAKAEGNGLALSVVEQELKACVQRHTATLKSSLLHACARLDRDIAADVKKHLDTLRGHGQLGSEETIDVDTYDSAARGIFRSSGTPTMAEPGAPSGVMSEVTTQVKVHHTTSPKRAASSRRRGTTASHDTGAHLADVRISFVDLRQSLALPSRQTPLMILRTARAFVKMLVGTHYFSYLCTAMILSNTVLVGCEVEHMSHNELTSVHFVQTQYALNVWYTIELCLRIFADGRQFFMASDGEWRWNWMDIGLVSTSIIDMIVANLDAEKEGSNGVKFGLMIRSIRLMRMLRTLRILRTLRFFSTFRKMVFALAMSMQNLFWSLVMLFIVMYFFAVWFTAGVSDCLLGRVEGCDVKDEHIDDLHHKFGSVPNSMFTLYLSIAEGYHWGPASALLLEVDPGLFAVFLGYIQLTIFGVLNIVEAVFVESAVLSTQHSKEFMLEEKKHEHEEFAKQMSTIFGVIDTDGSGIINLEELGECLADERLQMYLAALDLDTSDAATLFTLLDWDDSGSIDINEFCEGCLKLKGEARSFDINCLLYNVRKLAKHIAVLESRCDAVFRLLDANAHHGLEE